MKKRCSQTFDLLDWDVPTIAPTVPVEQVRAGSLRGRMARAVSMVLREAQLSREDIAVRMTEFLQEDKPVTLAMLDAYASQAREEHTISAIRLVALAHATGDLRAIQVLTEAIDHSIVPSRYVPAIEDALLDDKIEQLTRAKKQKRAEWRGAR